MRDFTPPPVSTKDELGEVGLEYAFQIQLDMDERYESATSRGTRIYEGVLGGRVEGPLFGSGTVYPQGAGDYGLARSDGVEDVNTHILLNVGGEWVYIRHHGYERDDGYFRVAAYVDADLRGKWASVSNSVFVAVGERSDDGRTATFTYYEAV